MATRAVNTRKATQADWRIGLRRSIRRISQMTGAGALLLAMVFLGLALASYTQTDPSPSTAADPSQVSNWMGRLGGVDRRPRAVRLWPARRAALTPALCFGTAFVARGRAGHAGRGENALVVANRIVADRHGAAWHRFKPRL